MNSLINASESNVTSFEAYMTSLDRFVLYDGVRIIQMITGIIGNVMTLCIIGKLKVLKNGHILMIYMAVSDILVSCMVPPSIFTSILGTFTNRSAYWETLCMWSDYIYVTVSGSSLISYFLLSGDR